MKIHEYQAKAFIKKFGINVLKGEVATNVNEAVEIAKKIGGDKWVIKAQIYAGGRGKAGGVKLANSLKEVETFADEILGKILVTHQTGPAGKKVHKVLIEQACEIENEFYLGLALNRETGQINIMASSQGGVDIEQVAKETPEKITKSAVLPAIGYTQYIGRKLSFGAGLKKELIPKLSDLLQNMYQLYTKLDCTIAEINPLVLTKQGEFVAVDAKLNFDDNALFRHPEIEALKDPTEDNPIEIEASKFGLSYIALDGNIGCLVNGAGLAMGTMDIIQLCGGTPANFLDVGGSASKEAIHKAFSIILTDKSVKAILVNIFGGIMKCDVVAEGIVSATQELSLSVPLVVRLEGTNVSMGKKILNKSGLNIITVDDLKLAAMKVVEEAKKEESK